MDHVFLLVCNNNTARTTTLQGALQSLGKIQTVSEKEALFHVSRNKYDLCLLDNSDIDDAFELILQIQAKRIDQKIAVIDATPSWKRTREFLLAGAIDYFLYSPGNDKDFRAKVRGILKLNVHRRKTEGDITKIIKTILLADNATTYARTKAELLERAGFKVVVAHDSVSAKTLLEAGNVDLAILDIRLEDDSNDFDLSGLEVLVDQFSSIPAIYMTGYSTTEIVGTVFAKNPSFTVHDFLSKEEGTQALLSSIKGVEKKLGTNALVELTKIKNKLDSKAKNLVGLILWIYLAVIVLIWLGLFDLILIFGWDQMEPWTYLIGLGVSLGSYAYIMISQREFSPLAMYDRILNAKKEKYYRDFGFDLKKYEQLLGSLK